MADDETLVNVPIKAKRRGAEALLGPIRKVLKISRQDQGMQGIDYVDHLAWHN
jgi:hypothetical protein